MANAERSASVIGLHDMYIGRRSLKREE